MCSETLHYAGCAFPVEGLGPGKRIAMWVRGCSRHCAGCIAPELWDPGAQTPVADVLAELLPLLPRAEGLTISGGEPFEQAAALCALLREVRRHGDVEVLIYTGYRLEELTGRGGATAALLAAIDLLIDGPFEDATANELQWRGSDNQRVHLLSPRARRYAGSVDRLMPEQRPLQVQMLDPSRYRLIGIPRRGDLAAYRALMQARGIKVEANHE